MGASKMASREAKPRLVDVDATSFDTLPCFGIKDPAHPGREEIAEKKYHIKPNVVDLKSPADAQDAPTPYAVFAVIYDGQLLADHQISRTRFRNIMKKLGRKPQGRATFRDA